MRRPRDFRKALFACMAFVTASYLTFALVVYRWCGQWVASPSLGSAGPTVKKVAFGIGLVGLIVSSCLYCHVAAKYLFVRILRNLATSAGKYGRALGYVAWLHVWPERNWLRARGGDPDLQLPRRANGVNLFRTSGAHVAWLAVAIRSRRLEEGRWGGQEDCVLVALVDNTAGCFFPDRWDVWSYRADQGGICGWDDR